MVFSSKNVNNFFQEVVVKSTLNSPEELAEMLMRKTKKEVVDLLVNYSYACNNDKSTGTSLESAISAIMGSKVDLEKKHGYDSIYENGNTLEIKPENVYYPDYRNGLYIPSNNKRLNMLGKYNDFTWHAIIRYINGKDTNSSQEELYAKEIREFIDTYYDDTDYKVFMRVACSVFGKKRDRFKDDKQWWDMVRNCMPKYYKNKPLREIKKKWMSVVNKVRKLKGTVKPSMWNKYHVAGGAVGGKLIYVARIDFPIVYERLFEKLLEDYPPETRFSPVKSRCQIDFTCACINDTNKDGLKWFHVDSEIAKYRECCSNTLWKLIEEEHDIIVDEQKQLFNSLFEY